MDLLRDGLAPFVEREIEARAKKSPGLMAQVTQSAEAARVADKHYGAWDVAALLKLMADVWQTVFRSVLGQTERSWVSELRDWRNKWAHQEPFSSDDTERALDTMGRLLNSVSAAEQAEEIGRMRNDLRRLVFDEQVRSEKKRAGGSLIEAAVTGGLKPWREVVTPHPDVASGRYQQAEFAADLWQVHLGQAVPEYQDPREFFRRTFLTDSLKRLLIGGLRRVSGQGGDPVVQLQTNFGGGKTHSMLALFHLLSGASAADLPGVDALLAEAGVQAVPPVRRVVLVGNKISPGNPSKKPDGCQVRTLWGELAWQLGGKEAFERIRQDDERATNPGDALRELFVEHGPSLILIDEWVAYARQLHEEADLPGGNFETQFTFAQALTESAKLAANCLLVVSLPASDTSGSPHAQADDVEVGGVRGREALDRLRNVVGRLESSWRPASAEEGFEIVRRRLFEPLSGDNFKLRDVTASAFSEFYQAQAAEFPPECRTSDYRRRIQAAYPIHPEVFDQLYGSWSTLVKFQRTRGVLRLMAAVIHSLWEQGDKGPLILPASIPIDDQRVQCELTRYLSDVWQPILGKDVDGSGSLPVQIDNEQTNLGKISATRRVARTVYMGSAPTVGSAQKGIEDRRVKLGSVMPGESPALFGDALRRLAAKATYLFQDGSRYWYDTQPTVTRLAEDRAEQIQRDRDKLFAELDKRIRKDLQNRGDFQRVHPFPGSSADVPDDLGAALVVIDPDHPHAKGSSSLALEAAEKLFRLRGNAPRLYQNSLVFLAADKSRLAELEGAIARFLAWSSIVAEMESLDLKQHQRTQARTQQEIADQTVRQQLPEAFQWLLVPVQANPRAPISFECTRLTTGESLAQRACKRLRSDELLLGVLGHTILRKYLEEIPLWRGSHVSIRQLVEDFGRHVYLPRLTCPEVLLTAIRSGLMEPLRWQLESFAYAETYDADSGSYRGLVVGRPVVLDPDSPALLVRSEVAEAQQASEQAQRESQSKESRSHLDGQTDIKTGAVSIGSLHPAGSPSTPRRGDVQPPYATSREARPLRFHGTVQLDANRVGRDAGRIAEEVISHLTSLLGSKVQVTLEIQASLPAGASEPLIRTILENSRTLKFNTHGFESD
jgi:predicted AAA+ superfamily ATPase